MRAINGASVMMKSLVSFCRTQATCISDVATRMDKRILDFETDIELRSGWLMRCQFAGEMQMQSAIGELTGSCEERSADGRGSKGQLQEAGAGGSKNQRQAAAAVGRDLDSTRGARASKTQTNSLRYEGQAGRPASVLLVPLSCPRHWCCRGLVLGIFYSA